MSSSLLLHTPPPPPPNTHTHIHTNYDQDFKVIVLIFLFDWEVRVQVSYPVWQQILFLFFHNSICCGYSLKVTQRGTSNDYLQLFMEKYKKYLDTPLELWIQAQLFKTNDVVS